MNLNKTTSNDFMKTVFEIVIKIVLAVLFMLCLLNMPYGYYQVVRFAGMFGFCFVGLFSL